jgi:hypothetical protein
MPFFVFIDHYYRRTVLATRPRASDGENMLSHSALRSRRNNPKNSKLPRKLRKIRVLRLET